MLNLREISKEIYKEISEYLLITTIQFFKKGNDGSIVPLGCGVLFSFEDDYFIITAAHVIFDENVPEIYFRVRYEMISLESHKVKYVKSSGNGILDKIDIATIKITTPYSIEKLIKHSQFIGLEQIQFNPKQLQGNDIKVKSLEYLMFGYPAKKTKLKYNNAREWKVKGLFYWCGLHNIDISKAQEDGFIHHIFCSKMSKGIDLSNNLQQKLPQLPGMSGCGLWVPGKFNLRTGKLQVKLVGIFYGVQHSLMIFTKIDFAIELIRQAYKLPKMPKTHLKLNINFYDS